MLDALSPAHPHPLKLDANTWQSLRARDFQLIDLIAFLSKCTARSSPSGAKYCTPGRAWLAQQLGVSTRTITRATNRMARLGVLQKQQRRPRRGHWSTNLYRLVNRAGWRAAALCAQVRTLAHRMTQPARLASPVGRQNGDHSSKEALRAVIRRGLQKFAPS